MVRRCLRKAKRPKREHRVVVGHEAASEADLPGAMVLADRAGIVAAGHIEAPVQVVHFDLLPWLAKK